MTRRAVTLAALAVLVVAAGSPPAASAASAPASPIEHIVVIMMHGGTFDSYFGTRRGVDGRPGVTDPVYVPTQVLADGPEVATNAYNGGGMNRFGIAQIQAGKDASAAAAVDWQYTRETAPGIWQLADHYVLFDNWFSTHRSDALPNALSLIGAQVPRVGASTPSALRRLWTTDKRTVFDRAEAAGVSWGFYVGKLRTSAREQVAAGTRKNLPAQYYWAPVLSMRRFWDDPAMRSGISDQRRFYGDAAAGTLPEISYVLPSPSSHRGLGERTAERRLLSLLAAAQKGPDRDSTVVFVAFDSWGGYADHVRPPKIDGPPLGFRAPVLMISPLVRSGYVSSAFRDHGFLPAFISNTFEFPSGPGWQKADLTQVWSAGVRDEAPMIIAGPVERYEATGIEHANGVMLMYVAGLVLTALCLACLTIPAITRRVSS